MPIRTTSQRMIQPPPSTFETSPPSVIKNRAINTSSRMMKYRSASISLPSVIATSRRRRLSSKILAAAPLRPDARKSPPSVQVSLQTGWLLTARSTPV